MNFLQLLCNQNNFLYCIHIHSPTSHLQVEPQGQIMSVVSLYSPLRLFELDVQINVLC